MKKSIKQTPKEQTSSTDKKNTRPHTAKKAGYKEDVYNSEEQDAYNKSKLNKEAAEKFSRPLLILKIKNTPLHYQYFY